MSQKDVISSRPFSLAGTDLGVRNRVRLVKPGCFVRFKDENVVGR